MMTNCRTGRRSRASRIWSCPTRLSTNDFEIRPRHLRHRRRLLHLLPRRVRLPVSRGRHPAAHAVDRPAHADHRPSRPRRRAGAAARSCRPLRRRLDHPPHRHRPPLGRRRIRRLMRSLGMLRRLVGCLAARPAPVPRTAPAAHAARSAAITACSSASATRRAGTRAASNCGSARAPPADCICGSPRAAATGWPASASCISRRRRS